MEARTGVVDGALLENFQAVIAEAEHTRILERLTRGRHGTITSGQILGNGIPPYGYRYASTKHHRHFIIREDEARIVQLMFTWYVDGMDDQPPLSTKSKEMPSASV